MYPKYYGVSSTTLAVISLIRIQEITILTIKKRQSKINTSIASAVTL